MDYTLPIIEHRCLIGWTCVCPVCGFMSQLINCRTKAENREGKKARRGQGISKKCSEVTSFSIFHPSSPRFGPVSTQLRGETPWLVLVLAIKGSCVVLVGKERWLPPRPQNTHTLRFRVVSVDLDRLTGPIVVSVTSARPVYLTLGTQEVEVTFFSFLHFFLPGSSLTLPDACPSLCRSSIPPLQTLIPPYLSPSVASCSVSSSSPLLFPSPSPWPHLPAVCPSLLEKAVRSSGGLRNRCRRLWCVFPPLVKLSGKRPAEWRVQSAEEWVMRPELRYCGSCSSLL